MALQISKTLTSSVVGNYWRVISINVRPDENKSEIVLGLYVSKVERDNGSSPIMYDSRSASAANFSNAGMDGVSPVATAYIELKKLSDFSGALDV